MTGMPTLHHFTSFPSHPGDTVVGLPTEPELLTHPGGLPACGRAGAGVAVELGGARAVLVFILLFLFEAHAAGDAWARQRSGRGGVVTQAHPVTCSLAPNHPYTPHTQTHTRSGTYTRASTHSHAHIQIHTGTFSSAYVSWGWSLSPGAAPLPASAVRPLLSGSQGALSPR